LLITRTIRRKLACGLALVIAMLLVLSISGIAGLVSYRNVVHELDYVIHDAPHQADLTACIALLFEPVDLIAKADVSDEFQQQQFELRLGEARHIVLDFRKKLDRLPPSDMPHAQRPFIETSLAEIDAGLDRLEVIQSAYERGRATLAEQSAQPAPADGTKRVSLERLLRGDTAHEMWGVLGRMAMNSQNIPDPIEGFARSLRMARSHYRFSMVSVVVSSVVALLLMAGIIRSGRLWIIVPIGKLHEAARRWSQKDYGFRVQLNTKDEMSELADAFNEMTARVRESEEDYEKKVNEQAQMLVRSERMAGVGFLASGVAHEINNPLSAVSMASESLQGRLSGLLDRIDPAEAATIREYLGMIETESSRCRDITERLLDFSRGRGSARELTDVTRLIREVISMVQHLSKYRDRRIEFDYATACHVEVNGPQIKQVVLNLVANGLQAMQPGQTLRIAITEHTDQLLISFSDEGCGMTSETIATIFDPFFTTKPAGQGTGLGLTISHNIVEQHGGTITAASAGPGKGSTFCVRLPRKATAGQVAA
jgi:signal transduction histidine kinase